MFSHFRLQLLTLLVVWGLVACVPTPPANPNGLGSAAATAEPEGGADEAETVAADEAVSTPAGVTASPSPTFAPVVAESGETMFAPSASQAEETLNGLTVGINSDGRAYIGQLDAPVVIEEFSDYQCPFCARFAAEAMPMLLKEEIAAGEAVIVFYDFPLESIHPQAFIASLAARCVGEQSPAAYWEMHDLLFQTVPSWSNDQAAAFFKELSQQLELDEAQFATCLDSEKYAEQVKADLAIGQARGVTGTPTFFLNKQMMVGAQPYSALSQAIAKVAQGEALATAPETAPPQPPADVEIPAFEMPEALVIQPSTVVVLGSPSAPITIVEFSDYQCPFCNRHVSETMPQLLAEMIETGRVRYEFKDFPLESIHPDARGAAIAARCAGDQEGYWAMHDALFANQNRWSGQGEKANEIYISLADELQLDTQFFQTCLESGNYDAAVQADLDEGMALGITGTPTFFINGYGISGARPYELFDMIVTAIEEDRLEQLYREAYDAQVAAYQEQQAQAAQPTRPAEPVEVPTEGWPTIGSPDAPITIIEYTDFQCPYCGRHFAETYPLIQQNYVDKGLVRYVFKDFPLNFHLQAQDAAEAARCANDQEAYLAMHDYLFETQAEWSGREDAVELFIGYAKVLELDVDTFTECLTSDKYAEAVQIDYNEGLQIGISGTPSFLVNGTLVVGAVPYPSFDQALQTLLAAEEN